MTTWDFIDNAGPGVLDALKRKTKKTNGAKSTGLKEIWDLAYLFEYVDNEDFTKMSLTTLTDFVIMKIRGLTGWRSADLVGLFPDYSFDWTYDHADNSKITALRLRTYDTKVKKGVWSAYTTIPVLSNKYRFLCAVRAIRELLQRWGQLQVQAEEINNPDGPGKVSARPLLVCTKGGKVIPYKQDTIGSKFKRAFLSNVTTKRAGLEIKLSELYKPHSCRNAVASALNDLSLSANTIAAHMNTSAQNLEATYITKVTRDWHLPLDCAAKHTEPAAKLLLPYVHYISTQDDRGQRCDCANLLGSIPK